MAANYALIDFLLRAITNSKSKNMQWSLQIAEVKCERIKPLSGVLGFSYNMTLPKSHNLYITTPNQLAICKLATSKKAKSNMWRDLLSNNLAHPANTAFADLICTGRFPAKHYCTNVL